MIGDGIFVSALFVFLRRHPRLAPGLQPAHRLAAARRSGSCSSAPATPRARSRARSSTSTSSPTASSASSTTTRRASASASSIPAIIGTPADIDRLIAEHHIDRIVVGLSDRRGKLPVEELLRAKMAGHPRRGRDDDLRARHREDPDRRPAAVLADFLRRLPRVAARPADEADHRSRPLAACSRSLAFPLMVLTALRDRCSRTAGPVLYRQERVGENGRTFTLSQVPLDAQGRREERHADVGDAATTIASPGSAASSARRGSTSCRSCGTCSAAT